jgi:predicted Rossmann fold flavoprotein
MEQQSKRVVVVGAGAAGMFGAIACAEAAPNAEVYILEAGREPLTKVRISGGGRCNVTHACFDPAQLVNAYPRGSRALRGAFARFQPKDTVQWFHQRGVPLKTEADGRMFPTTDDSGTIIDCLLGEAGRLGIQIFTSSPVQSIHHHGSGFQVLTGGKGSQLFHGGALPSLRSPLLAQRVLLATGSSPAGFRLGAALGHTLVPPVPSLFTFKVTDSALTALAGVSVESATLTLRVEGEPVLKQHRPPADDPLGRERPGGTQALGLRGGGPASPGLSGTAAPSTGCPTCSQDQPSRQALQATKARPGQATRCCSHSARCPCPGGCGNTLSRHRAQPASPT